MKRKFGNTVVSAEDICLIGVSKTIVANCTKHTVTVQIPYSYINRLTGLLETKFNSFDFEISEEEYHKLKKEIARSLI